MNSSFSSSASARRRLESVGGVSSRSLVSGSLDNNGDDETGSIVRHDGAALGGKGTKRPLMVRSDSSLNMEESAAMGFTTPNLLPMAYHESIDKTDKSFRLAALTAFIAWLILLHMVRTWAPADSYHRLDNIETVCTILATAALAVSNLQRIVPLMWRRRGRAFSGIIVASCTIQFIAMATNAIMLSIPTPVVIDPITGGRVHLLRWAEWAPLAAVMTFLTEGVDVPDPTYGMKIGIVHGLCQGVSTLCGMVFPFVPNLKMWLVTLTTACTLFLILYVRIYQKSRALAKMDRGRYADEVELYDRARLSLRLMTACAGVWTLLIALYFFSWLAPKYFPDYPVLGWPSLPMLTETSCELWSKVLYLLIIVDVHDAVFDESLRAERRLQELRYMMSAVWESSSDVIAISVRNSKSGNVTTMVSPTFVRLEKAIAGELNDGDVGGINVIGDSSDSEDEEGVKKNKDESDGETTPESKMEGTKALVFELGSEDMSIKPRRVSSFVSLKEKDISSGTAPTHSGHRVEPKRVHFVELKDIPTRNGINGETDTKSPIFKQQPYDERADGVVAVGELLVRAWHTSKSGQEVLLMHDIIRADPKTREERHVRCEAKVTRLENDAILVVVRDISERFRRFEAEKRVVIERTARTKDAEANRFTRHEVKNGLLAAIGLCDTLREAFDDDEDQPSSSRTTATITTASTASPTEGTPQVTTSSIDTDTNAAGEKTPATCAASALTSPADLLSSASKAWKRKLHGASGQEVDFDVRQCMNELNDTLREVLDTILAQSMARDVMHGIYEPKVEKVDLELMLHGERGASSRGQAGRFPLITHPHPLPRFLFDPQLFRYIHRNATSNACKYGQRGGAVVTEIRFDQEKGELFMDVINFPGDHHRELVDMGSLAEKAVFDAGKRLHPSMTHKSDSDADFFQQNNASHSSGDGAWIAKKCAKTLGGDCAIKFEPTRTVFTLRCPARAVLSKKDSGSDLSRFRLPSRTWGIAIDDSKIQRKLLGRFLGLCGIEKERTVVLGEDTEEIMKFDRTVIDIIRSNPTDYVLVIVDENLDVEEDKGHSTVSGSLLVEAIRSILLPEEEKRMLALVRSANDSRDDIALYKSRAHGFLLKAPVKKDSVLETIQPWWVQRFRNYSTASIDGGDVQPAPFLVDDVDEIQASSADIMQTLDVIDALCRKDDSASLGVRWPVIWDKLHVLKGDMKTLKDSVRVSAVLEAIDRLEGSEFPEDFPERWLLIKSLVTSVL